MREKPDALGLRIIGHGYVALHRLERVMTAQAHYRGGRDAEREGGGHEGFPGRMASEKLPFWVRSNDAFSADECRVLDRRIYPGEFAEDADAGYVIRFVEPGKDVGGFASIFPRDCLCGGR